MKKGAREKYRKHRIWLVESQGDERKEGWKIESIVGARYNNLYPSEGFFYWKSNAFYRAKIMIDEALLEDK